MTSHRPLAALAALVLVAAVPLAASAAQAAPGNPCDVEGWYVNPDEAARTPERTTAGFVFEDADLIHHDAPAGLTTATLNSGHYAATPAPDQPSFFSVEVAGDDGGYGTLRYNRLTHLWNLVTGGVFYENADPDELVDMPPVKRSHTVVRFGVGYTANPPGTVKTAVTSVSFQGKAYAFTCQAPTQSPSATPSPTKTSASPSASVSVTPSRTSTATPGSTSASPSVRKTGALCRDGYYDAGHEGQGACNTHGGVRCWYSHSAAHDKQVYCVNPSGSASITPAPVPSDAGSSDDLPVTGASVGLLVAGALTAVVLGVTAVVSTRRRRRTP